MTMVRAAAQKTQLLLLALTGVPAASLAQTAPVQAPAAPVVSPPVSPLSQIPGVTVRFYDVTGVTIPQMRASIEAQRPINPETGLASPSSSQWSIATTLRKQTTGNACKIVGATAAFKGEVVLPRLVVVEGAPVPVPVMAEWHRYLSSLEQQQAALMRQVHSRLPEVESAVMASSCEGADEAATRAINAIRQSLAAAPPPAPAAAPAPTTN